MSDLPSSFTTPRSSSPAGNTSTSSSSSSDSSSSSSTRSVQSVFRRRSKSTPSPERNIPLGTAFSERVRVSTPDPEYYRKTYSTRLPSGDWLAHGINSHQVVNNVPIVGYLNQFDQPLPSIIGPGVQLTLATMDEISQIGEDHDEDRMMSLGQVFFLKGPRKGQLNDAYAWIALRGDGANKFAMSRGARNRLVPKWKDLVEHWEEFDESVTDACHELRRVSTRAIAETIYCIKELGTEKRIDLLQGEIEDIIDREKTQSNPNKVLVDSAREVLLAASAFEEAVAKLQLVADKLTA
ncbi:hypothetical protein N7539_008200 [Penicillium diatomitis]|uniref:Uncharacterized protein n=1 Tax=Penicillium diatomitis TaxID=2819901 RepID=A0A9W9WTD4_9EURO|nr:uncharacterized protein N7539_008200 [Penicillium diatomitis]KAJ5475134.1 hypothetical protein N7539_008200 [Penicillium diatomitis]